MFKSRSDEVRNEALKLLRSPYFFREFLADVHKAGLVGEEQNALVIKTLSISRLLEQPLNVFVKGSSAAGKNFLVKSVLQFLPDESWHELTGASEKGFFNLAEDKLQHTVVFVQEESQASEVVGARRLLISEGLLARFVSVRRGSGWVSERQEVKGPVACISTTTENQLQVDDESRHVSLWIDESEEQSKRLLRENPKGRFHLDEKRLAIWH